MFFLILFTGAVPKMPKADELKFKTKPDGYVSVDLTNELHHYHAYTIYSDFYDYKNCQFSDEQKEDNLIFAQKHGLWLLV